MEQITQIKSKVRQNRIKSILATVFIASAGGSGSVTSVSGLSPLFTVSNPTTTPTFTAINQNANLFYSGPLTGAAAAPSFRGIGAADINVTDITATNLLKFTANGLNAAQTNGAGLWLANITAAQVNAQQWSPSLSWEGQGWKTNATAGSQSVSFTSYIIPVQSGAAPTVTWVLASSINGGVYTTQLQIDSAGTMTVSGNIAFGATRGFLTSSGQDIRIAAAQGGGGIQFQANSFSNAGNITQNINWNIGAQALTVDSAKLYILQTNLSSAWIPVFRADPGTHTAMTANQEFNAGDFRGATWTWLAGTVPIQRFNYFRAPTFAGASLTAIFTQSFNVFVEAPIQGSNASLQNNYAIGSNGSIGFTATNSIVWLAGNGSINTTNGVLTFGASNGNSLRLDQQDSSANGIEGIATINRTYSQIAGTGTVFAIHGTFAVASGNALFRNFLVDTTFNFTGTFAGTLVGFVDYAPTVSNLNGITHLFMRVASGSISLGAACNFILDTGTGTKFGTATNQKLSFWNATPIIQPSGANQAALTDNTTGTPSFTLVDVGLVFNQGNINNNFASLYRSLNEVRNVLVNTGLMKGSA